LAGNNFILGVGENTDSKLVLVVISLFEMLGHPKHGQFVTYPCPIEKEWERVVVEVLDNVSEHGFLVKL